MAACREPGTANVMNHPLEIELKLDLDPRDCERLDLTDMLGPGRSETHRLVSTYFDTPDLALRAAGYSLRVRRRGKERTQTVKANGGAAAGLFRRAEWERSVPGDEPVLDRGTGPLTQALPAEALAGVAPQFVSDIVRTTRMIEADGSCIEAAMDRGVIRAGARAEAVCELELELKEGSAQALFDVARRLDEIVPVRLGARSKAERGYALAAGRHERAIKAEPIRLDPDGSACDAFDAIARSCIRQFRLNEALLLQNGEAEPLHQTRVGLRRLRSAFSLFKPVLANDGRAVLLRAEIGALASTLGDVRNLDVLIPKFDGEMRDRLAAARAQAFAHARTQLVSASTRLLMIDLTEWLTLGAWRTEPKGLASRDGELVAFADAILERSWKRLKRRGKGLAGLSDAQRHKVRIEAKKLRYATEFFASLHGGKKARRMHAAFLERLEALQDCLGELNDFVVGPEVLARLGIAAGHVKAGKNERRQLLDRGEAALDALIDTKKFW